jgi:hypothetical protein
VAFFFATIAWKDSSPSQFNPAARDAFFDSREYGPHELTMYARGNEVEPDAIGASQVTRDPSAVASAMTLAGSDGAKDEVSTNARAGTLTPPEASKESTRAMFTLFICVPSQPHFPPSILAISLRGLDHQPTD